MVDLQVSQVVCERGARPLFAPVSFSLGAGQALQLEGANGRGKTTLLRVLCGLATAHGGEVRWQGAPMAQVRADFHRQMAYLGHALALKEELSALENLCTDAALAGVALSVAQAQEALSRMGLRGREHLPLRVLSQGQKRRTALARVMTRRAPLWILDEPFVALDAQAVEHLCRLLGNHVAQGGALLFTSHQPVTLPLPEGGFCAVEHLKLEPHP